MPRILSLLLLTLGGLLVTGCSSSAPQAVVAAAQSISPQLYQQEFVDSQHLLVDVRTPEEYAAGYIEGAVNIPLQELESRLEAIPRDIPVVVYCRSGNRSAQAAVILTDNDYRNVYDLGGVIQWEQAGYQLMPGE